MAIKILIGGSPCTYWSIAQTNNRETKAEGMGWELFKNYLIAKEKFKPDYFLYENNKSASQAIKDQIAEELGVGVDPDVRFTYINSALVSAQNRQRFYVTNFGDIEQPEDRGILLKDILETGCTDREKGRAVIGSIGRTTTREYFDKQQGTMACELVETDERKINRLGGLYGQHSRWGVFDENGLSPTLTASMGQGGGHTPMVSEPVRVGCMPSSDGEVKNGQAMRVYSSDGKSVNLTAQGGGLGAKTGLYAIPVNVSNNGEKAHTLKAQYYKNGIANFITNNGFDATSVAEPVRIPEYGIEEKSRPLSASYAHKGSGEGSLKSDAFPDNPNKQVFDYVTEPLIPFVERKIGNIIDKYGYLPEMFNPYNQAEITEKTPTQTAQCGSQTSSSTVMMFQEVTYATPCEWDENGVPTKAISCADGKTYTVYEVKDGQITIKGKQYPIKLVDGYYIIRKLTVRECARLQTMPDDYCKAVSDSQAYKALGNGWTAEVIIHLLNHALKDVPRDEEIVVLSLYDGIATGRYCLEKMGFTNVKYHAYEIDKYPIQVAMDNYPDIIQHGDAFAVREDDWKPPQTRSEWLDELLGV